MIEDRFGQMKLYLLQPWKFFLIIKLGWSTGHDSGLLICSPRFDSWPLQLQDLRHFWIIFLLFKNSPNFWIFSMTPLLSGNYRKHRIFSDESRDTKEGPHIFSLLVCDGLPLKMRLENKLFTMLKPASEGPWVQTPNFPNSFEGLFDLIWGCNF